MLQWYIQRSVNIRSEVLRKKCLGEWDNCAKYFEDSGKVVLYKNQSIHHALCAWALLRKKVLPGSHYREKHTDPLTHTERGSRTILISVKLLLISFQPAAGWREHLYRCCWVSPTCWICVGVWILRDDHSY